MELFLKRNQRRPLVSESDETAGQTENRLNKQAGPDDDDLGTLISAGVLRVAHCVAVAPNLAETASMVAEPMSRVPHYFMFIPFLHLIL